MTINTKQVTFKEAIRLRTIWIVGINCGMSVSLARPFDATKDQDGSLRLSQGLETTPHFRLDDDEFGQPGGPYWSFFKSSDDLLAFVSEYYPGDSEIEQAARDQIADRVKKLQPLADEMAAKPLPWEATAPVAGVPVLDKQQAGRQHRKTGRVSSSELPV